MKVLVPISDHSYREATVRKIKVVYNKKYRAYSEYVGEDHLEDGDEVIEMDVAE
jgi:hypothetical protein